MILCLRCGEIGTDKQMLLKLANNHFHLCKERDTIINVPCSIYVRTSFLRIEKVLTNKIKSDEYHLLKHENLDDDTEICVSHE